MIINFEVILFKNLYHSFEIRSNFRRRKSHFDERSVVGGFEIDRNLSPAFEECRVTIEIEKERKDKMKLPVEIDIGGKVENWNVEIVSKIHS